MKNVILHVGMHKTGSSSIQLALEGYSADKVRSASFKERNHSIPIYTIFSSQRYKYRVWKNMGYNTENINKIREKYIDILEKDLKDPNYETLIISGEDISKLKPPEIKEFLEFLLKYGVKIKVIMYVRNPLNWVISKTQEDIKAGHLSIKSSPNYKLLLQPFLDYLPKNNVLVYSYEDAIKSHESVVQHFAYISGIELAEPKRSNISLTPLQMAVTHYLNMAPLQIRGNRLRMKLREKILSEIYKLQSDNKKYQTLDKRFFHHLCDQNIAANCAWLKTNFQIQYTFSKTDNHLTFDQYFKQVIDEHEDEIIHFFNALGIKYNPSISLPENFLEAYFELSLQGKNIIKAFCAKTYLLLNPDVKIAEMNPYEHYIRFGIDERRKIS